MTYSVLFEGLRREYHGLVAEAVEREEEAAGTRIPGEVACFLTSHYLLAGRPPSAHRYLERALDHLERAYRCDECASLARRALTQGAAPSPAGKIRLLLRICGALERLGRAQECGEALDEARRAAQELGDPAALAHVGRCEGRHLVSLSRRVEARRAFEAALDLARKAGDRILEANITGHLGVVPTALGRVLARLRRTEEAGELLREAVGLARQIGEPTREVRAAARLAAISPEVAPGALAMLRHHEDCVSSNLRLEVLHSLWCATADPSLLVEAKQTLGSLLERAGPDRREGMVQHVALCREVAEAEAGQDRREGRPRSEPRSRDQNRIRTDSAT